MAIQDAALSNFED